MRAFLRRHWKILVPVGVIGLAVAYYLVFIFFAVHLLFVDDKVNESGPLFDSGAVMTSDTEDSTVPEAESSAAESESAAVEPAEDESSGDEAAEDEPSAPMEVVRLVEGSFIDRSHPTEGVAVVLNDGTRQRFLRFEDFATDNGPDLNVYLSSAPADAPAGEFDDDFVDLGDLKGNIGAQNYEIPTDMDLSHHSTVVIWCVRFSVAFGAAELS
ncbi:MAG: DM13 domain-containing protein [Acidimicrobiaceae bacterium]|nr:DM13 domain-containing protein [Acidimicrobiaceae bacterium]MXW62949.1 DM13 domain-containing protein [Acidimicrobiaceae bacterium]MYA74281.1 DM13 domain-containing protein [Acidimicrobiaceae bacterium]MYC41643.1 DM13 domain-containing protein [Acidimicrobiaceae bacterium]MYG55995.1 DM13 domain-containing protein [Acidimicrobiaceae bacterium]